MCKGIEGFPESTVQNIHEPMSYQTKNNYYSAYKQLTH